MPSLSVHLRERGVSSLTPSGPLGEDIEGGEAAPARVDFAEGPGYEDIDEDDSPPRKLARDPGQPTREEVEAHRVDHMPFRSWCPYCVKGRATGRQHRRIKEDPSIPEFGFDYLHGADLTGRLEEDEVEEEQEAPSASKILVAKCQATKTVFAHVVPQKGVAPDGFAIAKLRDDILWHGHSLCLIQLSEP